MNPKELFAESKTVIPGGVNSPVRAFEPYPFFVKEAKGSHIIDTELPMVLQLKMKSSWPKRSSKEFHVPRWFVL